MIIRKSAFCIVLALGYCMPALGQHSKFDQEAVVRGRGQFKSACGFCHGEDASGSRAPDLIRSAILSHDTDGDKVGPVIRNGRPDKGMPAFANLNEQQVSDIVTFLHFQAYEAAHSAHVPGDYPLAKMLTGNAEQGKAYFNGAGGCAGCHSTTGDLAGIASRVKPVDLQQRFVYPAGLNRKTATVTLADGQTFEGALKTDDEFVIAIVAQDGWYHSWPRDQVKVTVHDPLAAHRALTSQYTNADMHNVFAYLETLK